MFQVWDKYFGPFNQRNVSQVTLNTHHNSTIQWLPDDPVQVCAVGWEPNPAHTELLKKLEKSYNDCGFRTIIHTETGVDVRNTKNKVAIGIIVPSL